MAQVDIANDWFPRSKATLIDHEIAVDRSATIPSAPVKMSDAQRTRLGSVVRLLETAGQTLSNGNNAAYRCVAKAAALLLAECELGASERPSARRRDRLPAWKMNRVLGFVETNLDRPIRIEEMASLAKLSCSHFSRAFRSTVGEPPSSFVIRRRVERASQLILLTEKPLSQIALDCGMADQSHLTKLFRRSYGMSPGKWRKLQQGSEVTRDRESGSAAARAYAARTAVESDRCIAASF